MDDANNNGVIEMNEEEANAVDYLRRNSKDLLTKHYGTDYNLLRWAQGYGFNLEEALAHLTRHLKFRNYYDTDHILTEVPEHQILKQYFPIGLVGETGQDNTLLVIECAGRIDLLGILKSVQLSDFLIQRSRFQEKMLSALNEVERRTGKQAAVVYILDLEGLKFDSALLNIVTGPYRILWASVYENYPEWISHCVLINTPAFMSVLWKAIGPLLPERTRSKVSIHSAGSDWKSAVRKYVQEDKLPAHWGGTLVDGNGDPMCRDRLNIPFEPIPSSLYWQPSPTAPAWQDMEAAVIPAGKGKIYTYVVPAHHPTYIVINRFCDRTFGMGIWHSEEITAVDWPLEQMNDWCPDFDYPGMPTTDNLRIKLPAAGVYKIKWGNEQAWIRSNTVYFRIGFENEAGEPVEFDRRD